MRVLSIIKTPAGSYTFVGLVPDALAFIGSAKDIADAKSFGPGLVRKIAEREGRVFAIRTWATEQDARDEAASLGLEVKPPP